jgi:hypothetical protein
MDTSELSEYIKEGRKHIRNQEKKFKRRDYHSYALTEYKKKRKNLSFDKSNKPLNKRSRYNLLSEAAVIKDYMSSVTSTVEGIESLHAKVMARFFNSPEDINRSLSVPEAREMWEAYHKFEEEYPFLTATPEGSSKIQEFIARYVADNKSFKSETDYDDNFKLAIKRFMSEVGLYELTDEDDSFESGQNIFRR